MVGVWSKIVIEERAYWLAWSGLHRVGPILIKRIYVHFGSLAIAWKASIQQLLAVDGIGEKLAESIVAQRRRIDPAKLLERHSHNFWTPADAAYPALLFEICDPPPVLYYRGRSELIERVDSCFAAGIVGTRKPTDYGCRWTRQLTHQLVRRGSLVVSGLAIGIDREAHQSTLDCQGDTIAVLGTGVDVAYPLSNRQLYEKIVESGLVVSEYPNGTPPDRTHFPQRNRIIAGLSRAVVVTEAPERSGALITAYLANDYGREVYALPGSLDNPQSRGCLNLVNQGAQMILNVEDLTGELAALPPAPEKPAVLPQLREPLNTVFQKIPPDGISFDALMAELTLDTGLVLSVLTELEVMDLVASLPGMRYRRC